MLPAQVIERSQIERTYGHQLFNGTRRPSRDKVLQLALGLGLSVDETQRLLRAAGKSPLYPRLKCSEWRRAISSLTSAPRREEKAPKSARS